VLETYRSRVSGNRVDALISATDHHLVHDDLFTAQDDSVFANNTADGAKKVRFVNQ